MVESSFEEARRPTLPQGSPSSSTISSSSNNSGSGPSHAPTLPPPPPAQFNGPPAFASAHHKYSSSTSSTSNDGSLDGRGSPRGSEGSHAHSTEGSPAGSPGLSVYSHHHPHPNHVMIPSPLHFPPTPPPAFNPPAAFSSTHSKSGSSAGSNDGSGTGSPRRLSASELQLRASPKTGNSPRNSPRVQAAEFDLGISGISHPKASGSSEEGYPLSSKEPAHSSQGSSHSNSVGSPVDTPGSSASDHSPQPLHISLPTSDTISPREHRSSRHHLPPMASYRSSVLSTISSPSSDDQSSSSFSATTAYDSVWPATSPLDVTYIPTPSAAAIRKSSFASSGSPMVASSLLQRSVGHRRGSSITTPGGSSTPGSTASESNSSSSSRNQHYHPPVYSDNFLNSSSSPVMGSASSPTSISHGKGSPRLGGSGKPPPRDASPVGAGHLPDHQRRTSYGFGAALRNTPVGKSSPSSSHPRLPSGTMSPPPSNSNVHNISTTLPLVSSVAPLENSSQSTPSFPTSPASPSSLRYPSSPSPLLSQMTAQEPTAQEEPSDLPLEPTMLPLLSPRPLPKQLPPPFIDEYQTPVIQQPISERAREKQPESSILTPDATPSDHQKVVDLSDSSPPDEMSNDNPLTPYPPSIPSPSGPVIPPSWRRPTGEVNENIIQFADPKGAFLRRKSDLVSSSIHATPGSPAWSVTDSEYFTPLEELPDPYNAVPEDIPVSVDTPPSSNPDDYEIFSSPENLDDSSLPHSPSFASSPISLLPPNPLISRSPPPAGFSSPLTADELDVVAESHDEADLNLDDPSLSVLERVFLLTKSEYPHHRAFIARVIGDWLEDVDPCETVEYILPLLNSLGTDEDETVREALAPSLHKILWFFYTSCRLISDMDDYVEPEVEEGHETLAPFTATVSSEGLNFVRCPTIEDPEAVQVAVSNAVSSVLFAPLMGVSPHGPSPSPDSTTSSSYAINSTAEDTTTSISVDSSAPITTSSVADSRDPFETMYDPEGKELQPLAVFAPRPVISVQIFTPLIGTLLMSQSPEVGEQAKIAIITLLARLRRKELSMYDPWHERHVEIGSIKTYPSQVGPHLHRIHPLEDAERKMIEDELVQAIVIGMARLEDGASFGAHSEAGEGTNEQILSNPAGFNSFDWNASQSCHDFSPGVEDGAERAESPDPLSSIGTYNLPMDIQQPSAPANNATSTDVLDPSALISTTALLGSAAPYATSEAIERDSRGFGEEEWSEYGQEYGQEGNSQYENELALEACHGRLLAMNLISAVVNSGVFEGDEIIASQFLPEVLHMRFDASFAVRREAALAMGSLARVLNKEDISDQLLILFETFARDESPHVREAACVALPAICKLLYPSNLRRNHAQNHMDAFRNDESIQVQTTALEILGELIHTFHEDPEGVPEELIAHFLGERGTLADKAVAEKPKLMLGAAHTFFVSEGEKKSLICAFNFPAVALSVGRQNWFKLSPLYQTLCNDDNDKVRRSLAASLHEMVKIVGSEIAATEMVPFFRKCLGDDVDDIRERLMENMDVFLIALDPDTAWPLILEVAELLVQESLVMETQGRFLVTSLMRVGLIDRVAAVREATVKSVPRVYVTARTGASSLDARDALDEVLIELSASPTYRMRKTFVECLEAVLEQRLASPEFLVQRIVPNIVRVMNDPVVDVRYAAARCCQKICALGGPVQDWKSSSAAFVELMESLQDDESFDVRERMAWAVPEAPPPSRSSRSSSFSSALSMPAPTRSNTSPSSRTSEMIPECDQEPIIEDESLESALQLDVPSPSTSMVQPGFEVNGYAFPDTVERHEAMQAVNSINSGQGDPFKQYTGAVALTTSPGSEVATPKPVLEAHDSYFPPQLPTQVDDVGLLPLQ